MHVFHYCFGRCARQFCRVEEDKNRKLETFIVNKLQVDDIGAIFRVSVQKTQPSCAIER